MRKEDPKAKPCREAGLNKALSEKQHGILRVLCAVREAGVGTKFNTDRFLSVMCLDTYFCPFFVANA